MKNIKFKVEVSYPSKRINKGHHYDRYFDILIDAIEFIEEESYILGTTEDEDFEPTYMTLSIEGDANASIWDSRYDSIEDLNKLLDTGFYGAWGTGRKIYSRAWISPDGEYVDLTEYTPYALSKFLKTKGLKEN